MLKAFPLILSMSVTAFVLGMLQGMWLDVLIAAFLVLLLVVQLLIVSSLEDN